MSSHQHRGAARIGLSRRAVRIGLLATAGLTAVTTAASAQALGTSSKVNGVATSTDSVSTLANPGSPTKFDDSFAVHQYGAVFAASFQNKARALSAGCTSASPCRSIALSFQIDTMAGENIHLNASNTTSSSNVHCDGCQTLAGAYQFVVSTPNPFTLSAAAQRQLADIHRQLDALGKSKADIPTIQSQANALAAQVTTILTAAAKTAPKGPGVDALAAATPKVTMHRTFSY